MIASMNNSEWPWAKDRNTCLFSAHLHISLHSQIIIIIVASIPPNAYFNRSHCGRCRWFDDGRISPELSLANIHREFSPKIHISDFMHLTQYVHFMEHGISDDKDQHVCVLTVCVWLCYIAVVCRRHPTKTRIFISILWATHTHTLTNIYRKSYRY